MLAKLVSGNIPTQKFRGRIFIDRDGILFSYILDYLRNKQNWIIPIDKYLTRRIYLEAQYYGIEELEKLLYNKEIKRIKLWERYPTPYLYVSIHENHTKLAIYPEDFAKEMEIKSIIEETERKRFKGRSIAGGIISLYKMGYDLTNIVSALNGKIITYYFNPRYPIN